MMALKRVTKKVYSAPYKSRMDVKDAFMNECSFPLVYYTVNDYELHELHLPIKEKTYLCVELSVVVSTSETTQHLQAADAIAAIGLDQDRTPFPVPDGFEKVVLFQGAVPYTSLLDIYCQKGISGSTTLAGTSPQQKSSSLWGNRGGGGTTSSTDNLAAERVEYIMMRGPHGKGSCQVAIRDADAFRNAINSNNNAADSSNQRQQQSSLSSSSFSSSKKDGEKTAAWGFLKSLGNTVKNQLVSAANSFGNDGSGSNDSLQAAAEMEFKKPDELMCSMTYVTMPWQSIIR